MKTPKQWRKELKMRLSDESIARIQADAIIHASKCSPWGSGRYVQIQDIEHLAVDTLTKYNKN